MVRGGKSRPALCLKERFKKGGVVLDLQKILDEIGKGFKLNLTIGALLRVAVLLVVGMLLIRILLKLADRMMERSKALVSLRRYLYSGLKFGLWFLLVLIVAGSLNIDVTSIIALFSVAGLAVSLALQNTLSNLAGGIMLLAARPFVVGDYVEAEGVSGTVSAVDLSYTTFLTVDNKEIFVPNSQLSATKIINYTAMGKRRLELKFSASYDDPTQTVKKAIREAVDSIPQILPDPEPVIWLSEYQESSIQYVVRAWATSEDYWDAYYHLQETVRETFAKYGVEMTYNHLNVHLVEPKD
jgi:small conductance mechanosensitive channel